MDSIFKLIKDKGQRVTLQKKEVLNALQKKPLTVLEIFNVLNNKKTKINKVTIYRILDSIEKLNVVNKINFGDGEVRYELSNNRHHHHLVCEDCGKIEDIEIPENILLKEVNKKSNFRIKSHSLEFFGICNHCQ